MRCVRVMLLPMAALLAAAGAGAALAAEGAEESAPLREGAGALAAEEEGVAYPLPPARLEDLKASIEALPGMREARVGVALLIDGRQELLLGDRPDYPLMSVMKLPLAMAVLDRLEREGRRLDERVPFTGEELDAETWSPMREAYPEGCAELTLRDLLLYALQQSDNNATDLLFDRVVSPREVTDYLRGLGLDQQAIVFTEREMGEKPQRCLQNTMSPRCAVQLMEMLLSRPVLRAENRDFLLEALAGCRTGQNRIAAGLKEIPVEAMGHKTGTGPELPGRGLVGINDLAFVRLTNGHRYCLAVFVKDTTLPLAEAEALIAELSSLVAHALSEL